MIKRTKGIVCDDGHFVYQLTERGMYKSKIVDGLHMFVGFTSLQKEIEEIFPMNG